MKNNPLKVDDLALNDGRLDVQGYVDARKREIQRLESALANAQGKKRTFQTVPRVLRRRTASHNPKRVPKRLREKATKEFLVDHPNPPKKRRILETHGAVEVKDLVGNNQLCTSPTGGKYSKRQKDKVWLPTHIWHRKRAKIEVKWGYAIPTGPTQKQYRMSHRLMNYSKNGTLMWDTSYYGTMLLEIVADDTLAQLDKRFPNCSQQLYSSRSWQGVVQVNGIAVGPALLWRQSGSVMVNLHPSIFETVFNDLKSLGHVSDLRFAVGSIDLIGTRALSTLGNVFVPSSSSKKYAKLWGVENLDMLPYHGVLSFNANDPRLRFPPPKKVHRTNADDTFKAVQGFSSLQATSLFTTGRAASYSNMQSQSEIEKRKQPGEHIKPLANDPEIPIVFMKLEDARIRTFMPWHWVLPFWLSLVQVPNVYIAGTQQFDQLAFEQSLHRFPRDYPFTAAGYEAAQEAAQEAAKRHESRPKNIRPKLDDSFGNPFTCQWSLLHEQGGLVPVTVKVVKRGSTHDNARIFSIPDGQLEQWLAKEHKTAKVGELPVGNLVGFLTTGDYNLETGSGTGVGYATVSSGYCLVRNPGHEMVMLAKVEPVGKLYF